MEIVGKPLPAVAHLIASETRNSEGELIPTSDKARLFIDQTYPIGSSFECQTTDDENIIIGKMIAPPLSPKLQIKKLYEHSESPVDIDPPEPKEEEDEMVIDCNILLDVNNSTSDQEVKIFQGRIVHAGQTIHKSKTFNGIVVGYDFSNPDLPIVQFDTANQLDPFMPFGKKYLPEQDIFVRFVAVERYTNDFLSYLVVREIETGLEFVMDPYDVSLSGRNFVIDNLNNVKPSSEFSVTVEEIDTSSHYIHANMLKTSLDVIQRFMGEEKQRYVDAIVAEVRDNGLYLILDPANNVSNIPCVAFVHVNNLPNRPDDMYLGKVIKAIVKPRQWKRPLYQSILMQFDPHEHAQTIDKILGAIDNMKWDKENKIIEMKSAMSYDQRQKLFSLSKQNSFRKAIDQLFRRSNELEVRVI